MPGGSDLKRQGSKKGRELHLVQVKWGTEGHEKETTVRELVEVYWLAKAQLE